MTCNLMRRQFGDSLYTNGYFYELCIIFALLLFLFAIVHLGAVLLEIQYARAGHPTSSYIPLSWLFWDEILEILAANGYITTTVHENIA